VAVLLLAGHGRAEPMKTEVVIAEGVGVDVDRARKDAYRNAVRQVVGAYVDAETIVANDALITDRVITLSPAFIERVEPVAGSEREEDGLVRLRIRAWVRITKLLDELAAGRIKTRAITKTIDTDSLVAEMTTKSDQSRSKREILAKLFADYPESCLVVRQSARESIDTLPDGETILKVPLSIIPNDEAFMAFSKTFCEVLSATKRASGEFKVDGNRIGPNPSFEKRSIMESISTTLSRQDFHGTMLDIFPKSMHKSIMQSCDSGGQSPLAGMGSVYLLWDGSERRGIDSLYYGPWTIVRENRKNDLIVICLVSAAREYRRTSWKWFHVTEDERKQWLDGLQWTFRCRTELLDDGDEVVAEDTIDLRRIGAIGMYPNLLWIAPFYVNQHQNPWYTPELRFVRGVPVDVEEVARITALRISLETSPPAQQ
jgi:hypothetical protein